MNVQPALETKRSVRTGLRYAYKLTVEASKISDELQTPSYHGSFGLGVVDDTSGSLAAK